MITDTIKSVSLHLIEEDMSARRFAERSRVIMRCYLKDFFRWASQRGTPDPRTLTAKDLLSYHAYLCKLIAKRSGQPLAASTINGRFSAVELLLSCLYREGLITHNPAQGLDIHLAIPSGWRRRPLSKEEITRFLESIDTSTKQGLKDRTLFELIYSSGLRVSEAAALKVGDIDFDRRLMVVRGKFDRDRMVPISNVAHDFLLHFLGGRIDTPDAWIFAGSRGRTLGRHIQGTTISDRFRELLRRFDMDKPEISTHSIRHSTATHLLENGASVRHVQELLGHSNIESTVRYTHVMTDNLAKIYRRFHPREHVLYEELEPDYDQKLARLIDAG